MHTLSIVVVGRNDNHGGNFSDRLFSAAEFNTARLLAAGIDFEFLWIEWNPLPNLPLLAEEVVQRISGARAIVVESAVHDGFCHNSKMPVMEFVAKNVGIRRADAEFVLTTNADIVFGDNIIAYLRCLPNASLPVFLRANRHDLRPGVKASDALHPENLTSHTTNPPYFAEASGDFILASRKVFESLRGFNETIRFAKIHKDTQFCVHAAKLGVFGRVIGDCFHLYHSNSWMTIPYEERFSVDAPWGPPYEYMKGLPYLNSCDWGLSEYPDSTIGRSIQSISLPTAPIQGKPRKSVPVVDSDIMVEADAAWENANNLDSKEFRSEYVAGIARLLRRRNDSLAIRSTKLPRPSDQDMAALLVQFVRARWKSLMSDPNCRERGVWLFGCGQHTKWLLKTICGISEPAISLILDDKATPGQTVESLPVVRPVDFGGPMPGAIVLSSDTYVNAMWQRCREQFGDQVRLVNLYEGLSSDFLSPFKFISFADFASMNASGIESL